MARVVEAIESEDGEVRIVRIKTSEGEYTRPTAKLCLLEEEEEEKDAEEETNIQKLKSFSKAGACYDPSLCT